MLAVLALMIYITPSYGITGDEDIQWKYGHYVWDTISSSKHNTLFDDPKMNESPLKHYGGFFDGMAAMMNDVLMPNDEFLLRHYWNRLLEKNNLLEDFKKKFKHNNPNSTDVHAVWKVKNLGAYIAKYMSKNSEGCDIVNGRIWGCNYELSDKNKTTIGINRDEIANEMRCLMNRDIMYKSIETKDEITGKIFRQAELFFINLNQWKTHITGQIREAFEKRCYEIRDNINTPPLWYEM
jgi:hypothetical protein